jgi:hypothetical protein
MRSSKCRVIFLWSASSPALCYQVAGSWFNDQKYRLCVSILHKIAKNTERMWKKATCRHAELERLRHTLSCLSGVKLHVKYPVSETGQISGRGASPLDGKSPSNPGEKKMHNILWTQWEIATSRGLSPIYCISGLFLGESIYANHGAFRFR